MSLSDDERLDSQDPLRHFRATNDELVPEQPKSIHNELVEIEVPLGAPHDRTIRLSLAVDAGPGCGGITWPAGEVRAHSNISFPPFSLVIAPHIPGWISVVVNEYSPDSAFLHN